MKLDLSSYICIWGLQHQVSLFSLRKKENEEASAGVISACEVVFIHWLLHKWLSLYTSPLQRMFIPNTEFIKKEFLISCYSVCYNNYFHRLLSFEWTHMLEWADLLACHHNLLWLNLQQTHKMETFINLSLEGSELNCQMDLDHTIHLECDREKLVHLGDANLFSSFLLPGSAALTTNKVRPQKQKWWPPIAACLPHCPRIWVQFLVRWPGLWREPCHDRHMCN